MVSVNGQHVFKQAGTFTITTVTTDDGGKTVTTTTTATVAEAALTALTVALTDWHPLVRRSAADPVRARAGGS